GSMVVFEDGKPRKSDYRKFRIRTVVGPDDYASMLEVLTRRFKHGIREREEMHREGAEAGCSSSTEEYAGSFVRFPDLILMDGGKGQVTMAKRALLECGVEIPVCGMVKDDFHRTRALYYEGEELEIDTHSEGFKLITRIQDEAHRFAITYHRNLRSKDQIHSVLDDIEGIGPVRRKALMRTFGDVERIRRAGVEELAAVPEMNRKAAEKVVAFFDTSRKENEG
ncbi:MAG: excinuclease ABC subunit C, partial [Lachnospiraceae bacterium]|nr:excinuclease ABC subunit C [Lachnospiraceae bacterium]